MPRVAAPDAPARAARGRRSQPSTASGRALARLPLARYVAFLSRLARILPALGTRTLDEITTAELERFLDSLRQGERAVTAATVKESGGRIVYMPPAGPGRPAFAEDALHDALSPELRELFTVSVHTGLRWSEQIALEWRLQRGQVGRVLLLDGRDGAGPERSATGTGGGLAAGGSPHAAVSSSTIGTRGIRWGPMRVSVGDEWRRRVDRPRALAL